MASNLGNTETQKRVLKFRGTSLIINIGLLVSGAILATAVCALFYINSTNNVQYNSEVRKNIEMVGETLGAQIVGPMSVEDINEVSSIISDTIGTSQQIVDLIIHKSDGVIFYDSTGARAGKKFSRSMLDSTIDYVTIPLVLETKFGFGMEGTKEKIGVMLIGIKHETFLKNERIRTVVSFARSISLNISSAASSGDFIRVRDMMENLVSNNQSIGFAELIHTDGTILYYKEKKIPGKKVVDREGEKERTADGIKSMKASPTTPVIIQNTTDRAGDPLLDISVPVLSNGRKLGVVRIGYRMKDFLEKQRKTRTLMAWGATAAILAGLVLSLTISTRVSMPIRKLADAARLIGRGEMPDDVHIRTGGWETRELGASFNQMIAGLKERDLVKDTFSRYVTKQVADEILKNPDAIVPGGKKQEVTILFSDIRGFTTFSEKNTPEVVISHLNEYLSAMVDIIFKYEGTLDKFIGDAIMALFGAPLVHPDDPLRAAKTALEMQARVTELNSRWTAEGKSPLVTGIGINTGEVIVGNIGDIRRMEYTVIGDNVNLASRIEGLTKNFGCSIIISQGTYEKIRDHIVVRQLEPVAVKGKADLVQTYELIALNDTAEKPGKSS